MHDLLRWSIGRFSKLSDLYAHMSDYMAQLQETDNSSKKQFNELSEKIHELSNGLIGLSSSIRHTQEEQLKAARSSAKSLTDMQWQLSGVGKSVNTSTKESLLSIGKVLSQLGTSVPGVSPPGSAPGGFVTNPTTDGAPQATLGTGNVASPPGAEVDADQFDAANAIRVSSGPIFCASGLCSGCGTGCLHDSIDAGYIWMLIWIRRATNSFLETGPFG